MKMTGVQQVTALRFGIPKNYQKLWTQKKLPAKSQLKGKVWHHLLGAGDEAGSETTCP